MSEQIDVREIVVGADVRDRCLAAGQSADVALRKAAEAVAAWRNRPDDDDRLPPTFARDWPI